MTYVSKKEKVFDLPDQDDASSTSLKNQESRLKRFPSVSDKRAWTSEECQRYQHFYDLVNGSESNVSKSASFKYIPFDVLLTVLMAEKDAYIQELLERQDEKSCCGGKLYRAEGFEDSDDDRDALIRKDAEMVALKNKIAGLESELEDYRDTLTKAMHKLENLDEVMSENTLMKQKLKFAEEAVKCLEENKEELEKELSHFKRSHDSESESEEMQIKKERKRKQTWEKGDCEDVVRLSSERDVLLLRIESLQKELETTKINAAEIEVLKKLSETTLSSLEEMSRENESYKKKLETMKCLEKHVEALKKQAHTLTEKYKRESQKANDQMTVSAREVQTLREERDRLQKRVEELVPYEIQYKALQSKLIQVEMILDENEMLNKKLIQLDRLELENEQLKIKMNHLQCAEIEAAEDKEKITQLQRAVMDQEEEIRKMLRQIEHLSEGYSEKNEIHQLKNELEEKNGKLMQYEKQVAEIPVLESEIEELKKKLQKCIDDFKIDKDLLETLQEELELCQKRCRELEETAPSASAESSKCYEFEQAFDFPGHPGDMNAEEMFEGTGMTVDVVQKTDTESQCSGKEYREQSTEAKPSIPTNLEELEESNSVLRNEVERLRIELDKINSEDLVEKNLNMKSLLNVKEERIRQLESEVLCLQQELRKYDDVDELRRNRDALQHEVTNLKKLCQMLEGEIESCKGEMLDLEMSLKAEQKARTFARNLIGQLEEKLRDERLKNETGEMLTKLRKEETNALIQELYRHFAFEINSLKRSQNLYRKLINEFRTENQIHREMKDFSERVEKNRLKNLIKKLRAKINVLKSLSKPELEAEYKSLQDKVRILLKETDTLLSEINNLKAALESEKKAKDYLQNELIGLQAEITACMEAGAKILDAELAAKDSEVTEVRKELTDARHDLENSLNESQVLRAENLRLVGDCERLKYEQKKLKDEVLRLSGEIDEQRHLEEEISRLSDQIEKQKRIESELNHLARQIRGQGSREAGALEGSEKPTAAEKALSEVSNEVEEQKKIIAIHEKRESEYLEEIKALKEKLGEHKSEMSRFKGLKEELQSKVKELKDALEWKEKEIKNFRSSWSNVENEAVKENSETEVLMSTLTEKDENGICRINYESEEQYLTEEKDAMEEKYALEEALGKIEQEVEDLKVRLNDCREMEEEMKILKGKRDGLVEKMTSFESEIEKLKKKLSDFENVKNELEKLKSEKISSESSQDYSGLRRELDLKIIEIENLKSENENLHSELNKAENLMEVSKKLHKTVSQIQMMSSSVEFFTPPAQPSPRCSEPEVEVQPTNATIPVETHQKEVCELENYFRAKIKKIKEGNARKVKKLTLHHEKESKCRNKEFHDSINNIKSGYERGIRKLVEKHKVSIAKLQQLHEEEVEELNKNYEIQLETMEKQNENLINDVRLELAEKCNQAMEKHGRELRQTEAKYEQIIREKDAQILAQRKTIESTLHQTPNDINQPCKTSVSDLEEKHMRELKKCKKNNLDKIELMKNKYEDLLQAERKKYEEQLEELLRQLNKGHRGDSIDKQLNDFVQKRIVSSNPRLEFLEVLQKIINEGLESLAFDELILVHSKTCFLPEALAEQDEGGGRESIDGIGDGCKHKALMAAEREELLQRIFTLEREILFKEVETHEAILDMETAEKYRTQELKKALCDAQEKNAEIMRYLSNQSKAHMDRKELEKEKAENKRLQDELQQEKINVKNLAATLESEKERFKNQRKRDSDYVESIRQRLQDALSHEQFMESQLDYEARFRAKLESELQSLQSSFDLITDLPAALLPADSKAVKDFRNFDQCETKKGGEIQSRSKGRIKGASRPMHSL